MMNFIESKKSAGLTPHILFNAVPRAAVAAQELEIRGHKDYAAYCMNYTLKKFKAFSEPEGGKGFTWTSTRAYSKEALNNLVNVGLELMKRTGA